MIIELAILGAAGAAYYAHKHVTTTTVAAEVAKVKSAAETDLTAAKAAAEKELAAAKSESATIRAAISAEIEKVLPQADSTVKAFVEKIKSLL